MRQVFYSERRKVKITCVRKHREKAKANIFKAFIHQPTHRPLGEYTVCPFDTNSRMPPVVTNHAKCTSLGLGLLWLWELELSHFLTFQGNRVGGTELKFVCSCYLKPDFCILSSWKNRWGLCEHQGQNRKLTFLGSLQPLNAKQKQSVSKGRTPRTKHNQQEDFL